MLNSNSVHFFTAHPPTQLTILIKGDSAVKKFVAAVLCCKVSNSKAMCDFSVNVRNHLQSFLPKILKSQKTT